MNIYSFSMPGLRAMFRRWCRFILQSRPLDNAQGSPSGHWQSSFYKGKNGPSRGSLAAIGYKSLNNNLMSTRRFSRLEPLRTTVADKCDSQHVQDGDRLSQELEGNEVSGSNHIPIHPEG